MMQEGDDNDEYSIRVITTGLLYDEITSSKDGDTELLHNRDIESTSTKIARSVHNHRREEEHYIT